MRQSLQMVYTWDVFCHSKSILIALSTQWIYIYADFRDRVVCKSTREKATLSLIFFNPTKDFSIVAVNSMHGYKSKLVPSDCMHTMVKMATSSGVHVEKRSSSYHRFVISYLLICIVLLQNRSFCNIQKSWLYGYNNHNVRIHTWSALLDINLFSIFHLSKPSINHLSSSPTSQPVSSSLLCKPSLFWQW